MPLNLWRGSTSRHLVLYDTAAPAGEQRVAQAFFAASQAVAAGTVDRLRDDPVLRERARYLLGELLERAPSDDLVDLTAITLGLLAALRPEAGPWYRQVPGVALSSMTQSALGDLARANEPLLRWRGHPVDASTALDLTLAVVLGFARVRWSARPRRRAESIEELSFGLHLDIAREIREAELTHGLVVHWHIRRPELATDVATGTSPTLLPTATNQLSGSHRFPRRR